MSQCDKRTYCDIVTQADWLRGGSGVDATATDVDGQSADVGLDRFDSQDTIDALNHAGDAVVEAGGTDDTEVAPVTVAAVEAVAGVTNEVGIDHDRVESIDIGREVAGAGDDVALLDGCSEGFDIDLERLLQIEHRIGGLRHRRGGEGQAGQADGGQGEDVAKGLDVHLYVSECGAICPVG